MIIKTYHANKDGIVRIGNCTIRLCESLSHNRYRKAKKYMLWIKVFTSIGAVLFISGLLLLAGLVGRFELFSLEKLEDVWSSTKYFILNGVGIFMLVVGMLTIRWGYSVEILLGNWIDEYLGQFITGEEAVEE